MIPSCPDSQRIVSCLIQTWALSSQACIYSSNSCRDASTTCQTANIAYYECCGGDRAMLAISVQRPRIA